MKMPATSIIQQHSETRARDKKAFAMAEHEGITFFEAWQRILDAEGRRPAQKGGRDIGRIS